MRSQEARRVLAFRHVPFEGLGLIEDALDAHRIEFDYCDLYQPGAEIPPLEGYCGLIYMGGPMSVNDELPFLLEEMRLIERAAAQSIPQLGICLGSQLMARALGGRVYRNWRKEIGWYEIELTEEGRSDPVLGPVGRAETVFHWHGDTFDLPSEAVLLAASKITPHQAYRLGHFTYGLQFHLEVTPGMIVDWSKEDANCGDLQELVGPLEPYYNYSQCRQLAYSVFGQWCVMLSPRNEGRR